MKKLTLTGLLLSLFIVAVPVLTDARTDSEKKKARKEKRELSIRNRKRIKEITAKEAVTTISLPKAKEFQAPTISTAVRKDTIKVVDFEGKEMLLMKTVKDEDGNSVASQQLDAAVVTARFRHVAERHGKVDLEFQIIVPETLMDSRWQLRYQPTMYVLKDSVKLDKILITGREYRRKQMRGYEQYEKWLSRIITDSTKFIDLNRLEIFLARNIPNVYRYKTDTTFVSDEDFEGEFGVRESEAIDHYTRKYLMRWNDRMIAKKGRMYSKYVKAPYITSGIRLDTVININGNYVYNYVQELDLKGKRKLKKVDIVLDGQVYEQGDLIYDIPRTEPLTFYISSISAFVDGRERYITKVIERRATANRAYSIDFQAGKSDILPAFGGNAGSISEIKEQLRFLLDNKKFDLDSVVVVASASPEGSVSSNDALSRRRSESISRYFNAFMRQQIDSLNREDGFSINADETYAVEKREPRKPIQFKSRHVAENWSGLNTLVEIDSVMTVTDKEDYYAYADIADLDQRERRMRGEKWYRHLSDNLYPRLRTVQFQFILHRKGMVKDTLHTTEIDSVYMSGVQAIRDRDYELAASLLMPYNDYNTAIAYCALDRNLSALSILEKCEKTAQVHYMLAIIYSREGEEEKAVQHYMDACHLDGQYVHRGNLDPEVSALIKKYGLNRQDDDLF